MFEHVRHAGSKPFSLMDTARFAPGLSRYDRRAVIFAHDYRQPGLEGRRFHARGKRRNFSFSVRITRNVLGHVVGRLPLEPNFKWGMAIVWSYLFPGKSAIALAGRACLLGGKNGFLKASKKS